LNRNDATDPDVNACKIVIDDLCLFHCCPHFGF
jgi:hypothetical protein